MSRLAASWTAPAGVIIRMVSLPIRHVEVARGRGATRRNQGGRRAGAGAVPLFPQSAIYGRTIGVSTTSATRGRRGQGALVIQHRNKSPSSPWSRIPPRVRRRRAGVGAAIAQIASTSKFRSLPAAMVAQRRHAGRVTVNVALPPGRTVCCHRSTPMVCPVCTSSIPVPFGDRFSNTAWRELFQVRWCPRLPIGVPLVRIVDNPGRPVDRVSGLVKESSTAGICT